MGEPWIRVHANLHAKPVVTRAAESLDVSDHEAMGLLVQFWGAVSQYAVDGQLSAIPDRQLERWADWRGESGRFARFVREQHCDEQGRVNEWSEYAGKLEEQRAADRERKRQRQSRERTETELSTGRRSDNSRTSEGALQQIVRSSERPPRDVKRKSDGFPQEVARTSDGFPQEVTPSSVRACAARNETKRLETTESADAAKTPADVRTHEQRVIEYYRAVHPKRRPGPRATTAVRNAIALGYSADELMAAIDGNAADEWHRGRGMHELSYVLRDNDKIDHFRDVAAAAAEPLVDENGILTERAIGKLSRAV